MSTPGDSAGASNDSVPRILSQRYSCLSNACMQTPRPHESQVLSLISLHVRSYLSGLIAAHSLGMNRTFVRSLRTLRLVLLNPSGQQSKALTGVFVRGEDEAEESTEAVQEPAQLQHMMDLQVTHACHCLPDQDGRKE